MSERKLSDAERKAIDDYQADLDNDHLGPNDTPIVRISSIEAIRLRDAGAEKTREAEQQRREIVKRNASFKVDEQEFDRT